MKAHPLKLLMPLACTALMTATCMQGNGFAGPNWPSDKELTYLDLGTHDVKDTGGYSGELLLKVPEDATSVVVHCGGFGSALAAPWKVTAPDGRMVYDGDKPDEGEIRAEFTDDLSALVMPMHPGNPLTAGEWKIDYWVGKNNTGKVECGAVLRTDPVEEIAKLGMEFVMVGLPGINATNARENEAFMAFVKSLEKELAGAKVELVWDVVDFKGDVDKFTVLEISDDDLTEFNALLKQGKPSSKRVINVFMVQEISNLSAGSATILGLSAGPPGSAGLSGTSKSGLAVSALDLEHAPEDVSMILSHELGHFLGLFHTTEKNGSKHDPLSDTPECLEDGNENGVRNTHECTKAGSDNVMWWTLQQDGKRKPMSEEQSWLLRRSAAAD